MATETTAARHGFDPQPEHVKLGRHIYEVLEQPLPILKRDLHEKWESITSGKGLDLEKGAADGATAGAHALLRVFIPDLMPLFEWEGYRSDAAMTQKELDEETARAAPSGPQVRRAISVGFRVNGLDLWATIQQLVDPDLLQEITSRILRAMFSGSSPTDFSASTPESESPTSPAASQSEGGTGSKSQTDASPSSSPADPPETSAG